MVRRQHPTATVHNDIPLTAVFSMVMASQPDFIGPTPKAHEERTRPRWRIGWGVLAALFVSLALWGGIAFLITAIFAR